MLKFGWVKAILSPGSHEGDCLVGPPRLEHTLKRFGSDHTLKLWQGLLESLHWLPV